MKNPSLLGLLLLSPLAASTCAFAADTPASSTLAVGGSARGEITTAHRMNYSDGSRSIVYDLDLDANQAVALQASGALCAKLLVLHEGEVVAGPNEATCDASANANQSSLSMMAKEKGRYQVAVSGTGAQSYGPFRIEARALQVHRGNGPLHPGNDIVDFLRDGSNTYRLDVRQSGYYVIDMRSTELDSALELSGPGVSLEDDDGGDGLNSRLRVPLEPGSYTLRAKSVNSQSTGMFQLTISTGSLPAGVRLRNSGALATDGSTTHGILAGQPREYQLRVTRTSRVSIDLRSEDFDTVLELRGDNVSQENDDGGSGTDSRISTILQPGTYRVIARGLGDSASGLFQISATSSDLPAGTTLRTGGDLTLGRSVMGLMDSSTQSYQLTIAEPGVLVVDMTSDEFDAVLELHRAGMKLAEDDDGGGGSNARISASVEPGTYTIIAKSYGGGSGGTYELIARYGSNADIEAPPAAAVMEVPAPPSTR